MISINRQDKSSKELNEATETRIPFEIQLKETGVLSVFQTLINADPKSKLLGVHPSNLTGKSPQPEHLDDEQT